MTSLAPVDNSVVSDQDRMTACAEFFEVLAPSKMLSFACGKTWNTGAFVPTPDVDLAHIHSCIDSASHSIMTSVDSMRRFAHVHCHRLLILMPGMQQNEGMIPFSRIDCARLRENLECDMPPAEEVDTMASFLGIKPHDREFIREVQF